MIDEKRLIEDIGEKIRPEDFGEKCNAINVIHAVMQVINEQPKIGEWVPCSERLPDSEGVTLTTAEYGSLRHVDVAEYDIHSNKWDEYPSENIIAWMQWPWPEPYMGDMKEVEEE